MERGPRGMQRHNRAHGGSPCLILQPPCSPRKHILCSPATSNAIPIKSESSWRELQHHFYPTHLFRLDDIRPVAGHKRNLLTSFPRTSRRNSGLWRSVRRPRLLPQLLSRVPFPPVAGSEAYLQGYHCEDHTTRPRTVCAHQQQQYLDIFVHRKHHDCGRTARYQSRSDIVTRAAFVHNQDAFTKFVNISVYLWGG